MNFFWSDPHLGHFNVIKYCNRPFLTTKEMDAVIIEKYNRRVKKTDTVYCLGDFCFKSCAEAPEGHPFEFYRNQLNGEIVFIKGNHDKSNGFRPILQNGVIEYGGERIFMVHKPEHANLNYKINLVGHVHDAWKIKKVENTLLVNVGVDQWNFEPITIHQILKSIAKWKRENKV